MTIARMRSPVAPKPGVEKRRGRSGARATRRALIARRVLAVGLGAALQGLAFPAFADEPPDERGARGLLADLRRIVRAEESSGWFVDSTSYQAMYPQLLQSVCRASEGARALAVERSAAASRQAGDARALYRASHGWSAAAKEAAHRDRAANALALAVHAAPAECPFWITPARGFDGRQSDLRRFTGNFESGGLLQVRRTQGTWTYGGGGVLRVLLGYGLAPRASLLVGGEFAGGAMLRPRVQPSSFVVNYFPAMPVILRLWDDSMHYDLELAPVSLFQADDGRFSYGGRLGFSFGVSALKGRYVIPWAGAAFAVEHYVASGGRPEAQFFRGGLRVGVIWDGR